MMSDFAGGAGGVTIAMSAAAAAVPMAKTAGGLPKKAKVSRPKGPKKPSSHPSYHDMIKKAIEALKERNGSSRQAIQKFIMANYRTCADKTSQAHLKLALKRGVDSGFLKRVKGAGASGSFRLSDKAASAASPKKKAAAAKKPRAKKASATKKPGSAKPKTSKAKLSKKSPKKSAEKKASKPKVAKKPKTPKKAGAARPKKSAVKPKKPAAKKPAAK